MALKRGARSIITLQPPTFDKGILVIVKCKVFFEGIGRTWIDTILKTVKLNSTLGREVLNGLREVLLGLSRMEKLNFFDLSISQ